MAVLVDDVSRILGEKLLTLPKATKINFTPTHSDQWNSRLDSQYLIGQDFFENLQKISLEY